MSGWWRHQVREKAEQRAREWGIQMGIGGEGKRVVSCT